MSAPRTEPRGVSSGVWFAVAQVALALALAWIGAFSGVGRSYLTAYALTAGFVPLAAGWGFQRYRIAPPVAAATAVAIGAGLVAFPEPFMRVLGAGSEAQSIGRILGIQAPLLAAAVLGARVSRRRRLAALVYGLAMVAVVAGFGLTTSLPLLLWGTVAAALLAAATVADGLKGVLRPQPRAGAEGWLAPLHLIVAVQALVLANVLGTEHTAIAYLGVIGLWALAVWLSRPGAGGAQAAARRGLVGAGALVGAAPALERAMGATGESMTSALTWIAPAVFAWVLAQHLGAELRTHGRAPAVDLAVAVGWATAFVATAVMAGIVPRGEPGVLRGLTGGLSIGVLAALGMTLLAARVAFGSRFVAALASSTGFATAVIVVAAISARLLCDAILGDPAATPPAWRVSLALLAAVAVVAGIAWVAFRVAFGRPEAPAAGQVAEEHQAVG